MKRLFLIDGHGLAYRAFFAIKTLTNSKGMPTNAVYGFTTMLLKLLREEKPDYLLVTFDSQSPTFRHQAYPEYKAQRQKMPDEMRQQLPLIQEVIKAFSLPVLSKDGYEADDLLATLTKQWQDRVDEVIIVTGDKDALQLVDSKVKVLATKKGLSETLLYDMAGVKERFGVNPCQVVDVLGLAGDTSDNVPGVKGIGEKKAIGLIQEFGSIEQVYAQLEKVANQKMREQLETDRESAVLSKKLVDLDSRVPLNIGLEDCRLTNWNKEKLLSVLTMLEFRKIINDLGLMEEEKTGEYKLITSQDELEGLVRRIEGAGRVCLGLATTSGEVSRPEIIGIAAACEPHQAYYIPVGHSYLGVPEQLERDQVLQALKPGLESERIKKYGQNFKYELAVLAQHGIQLKGIAFDIRVAAYLLKPGSKINLQTLSFDYLGIKKSSFDEVVPKGRTFASVELTEACDYACSEADVSLRLVEILSAQLKDRGLESLFQDIEMPLVEVLAQMEQDGIQVDTAYLKQLSSRFGEELKKLEKEIYLLAGTEFNINSPKQLGFILFEKMQMPSVKKTKTGYSTNEEVLNELTGYHPLPGKLLEYRGLSKLKSTYVDALAGLVNPQTGRVHTSYNQAVTTTGRLSSSDPNLQNIPIKTELGRLVRQAFVPRPGCLLLSADYSQIELRLLAHISEDPNLIEAFLKDEDIHTRTAGEVFGVMPSIVTTEMRRVAKVVNFGITYGMSPYGLSKELNISQKQAKEIIERYFARYSKVKEYMEKTISEAREKGYVSTLWGRRRYLPDMNSSNKNLREFAQRQAINMPIQGSCADIIKLAMNNIHQRLNRQKAKMLLQVHDELVFEVQRDEVEEISSLVKESMENAAKLCVPIKVDIKLNSNWSKE